MKRFLLLLLPVALVLASCKKEYIVPNKTIVVDLVPGNWSTSNSGRTYTSVISIPELNDYRNERGGVLVYISFGEQTYEQIPQVYNGDAYSYVTRPGEIVLEVQRSDDIGIVDRPGNMTVKIILVESDF